MNKFKYNKFPNTQIPKDHILMDIRVSLHATFREFLYIPP